MDVFIIYGENNSGKTTTGLKLYDKLLEDSAKTSNPCVSANCIPSTPTNDFKVALDYKGKKILIVSEGDDCSVIERNIDDAISQRPDYFVFAIRKRIWHKGTLTKLQNETNCHEHKFVLFPPTTISVQEYYETVIAYTIFDAIQ